MAKPPNSKSKPHLFLSCFGFSGKLRRFKPLKTAAGHKKRPFSWMIPPSKPPSPAVRSKPDYSDRSSLTSITPTATCKSSNEDFAGEKMIGPARVKNDNVGEKSNIEICEHSDSSKKLADQSQSKFSFSKKFESFRSGRFAQPISPTVKKNLKSTTISHSLSFPPLKPASRPLNGPLTSMRNRSKIGEPSKKNNEPVMGTSILIFTLAIMVLWGKLCAILCTAIWIFMVTSLRSIVEEDDSINLIESDSYSYGFKKKLVVLKGFLYRNQRENLFKKL